MDTPTVLDKVVITAQTREPYRKSVSVKGVVALVAALSFFMSACSSSDAPKTNSAKTNDAATQVKTKDNKKETSLYAFETWAAQKAQPISVDNVNDAFAVMGMRPQERGTTLDFSGNKADQYKLRNAKQSAYINLVNSPKHIELTWIKPIDTDNAKDSVASIENTQKAYQYARSLLGEKGGMLVKSMVTEADFQAPAVINGHPISLARCDYFYCSLVVGK